MSFKKDKSDSKKKGRKSKGSDTPPMKDDSTSVNLELMETSTDSPVMPTPAKRARLEDKDPEDRESLSADNLTSNSNFLQNPDGYERFRSMVNSSIDESLNLPSTSIMNLSPILYATGIQSYLEASFSSSSNDSLHDTTPAKLDWVWDEASKSKACSLARSKTEVEFHMDYSCGTAAARSTEGFREGQIYWEIKMVSPVYGTDMMIGIGTEKIQMDQYMTHFCSMLGIDIQGESCGLSYSGHFYHGGNRTHYCNKFGSSTIIGIHLDLWRGVLTFYKNGKSLGTACKGLNGKQWFPMVSSTAARSSMRLVRTESFPSSLQFLCCKQLRQSIPHDINVLDVVEMPPGLKLFLKNNLSWLLDPCPKPEETGQKTQGTQTLLSIGARKMKKSLNKMKSSFAKWKKD